MDPFQRKYGKALTAALAVVPVVTEVVWIPALLISLGTHVHAYSNEHTHIHSSIISSTLFLHTLSCLFVFDYATGATMSVVLDLPFSVCVWISAAVAIIYTVLGGLYSVAHTDVVQMSLVLLSLVSFTQ